MESVKRYKAMVNLPDGVLVADVYLSEDFDRVTAERNALQLLLNNRDDRDDQLTSLEQRRYAEQQAREAAERRIEELQERLTVQDQRVDDLVDLLTHAHIAIHTMEPGFFLLEKIEAALNPTAEAVSHE